MLEVAEPERSIIRLTGREREELASCEETIASGLSEFLRVGRALSTIRNKRLYRETHSTFDLYVSERWSLGSGASGTLITAFHVAQQLEADGIALPTQTTQAAMRSLQRVPPLEGLRAGMWRYAVSLCPGTACPPLSVLRKISQIVRDALDSVDGAGNFTDTDETPEDESPEPGPEALIRGRPPGAEKRVEKRKRTACYDERFLRSLVRLSSYQGFSVPLIVSQIGSEKMASYTWTTCERMKERLDAIEEAIAKAFPNVQSQRAA
jgi:hypothetical protein